MKILQAVTKRTIWAIAFTTGVIFSYFGHLNHGTENYLLVILIGIALSFLVKDLLKASK
jgi:hypothetical protein